MVFVTAAEGEEILIDGHIQIRILAVHEDEACFEINFPEFLRSDNTARYEQKENRSRWPASSA